MEIYWCKTKLTRSYKSVQVGILEYKPEIVIIAFTEVGGINANNSSPARIYL